MRRPATVIQKLIDDINAVEDPAKRGELATQALTALKEANAALAETRQAAARELKDQGRTLQQIADLFGPGQDGKPLHITRIQQILKGGPTGRWARAARDANTPAHDD